MIAKQTNPAEIALDVMKAEKERMATDITETRNLRFQLAKEEREKVKNRKDKLATFYYSISMLFLTSSGIGGLSPFIADSNKNINWYCVFGGIVMSLIFACKANKELKYY